MWKDLQKALSALYKCGVLVCWLQVDGWGTFFDCRERMGENLKVVLYPFVFSRLSMHMINVASPSPSVAAFAS